LARREFFANYLLDQCMDTNRLMGNGGIVRDEALSVQAGQRIAHNIGVYRLLANRP
jgi:hypothetical protein